MKIKKLPKRLKLKEPWIAVDVEEDRILGWFTNVNGSHKVMMDIESFARDRAKATGHSVVLARGMIFY